HGARKPALQSCRAGSDSACTELLRSLPAGVLPRPLTYDARAALVHVALRLGGREAYHRLVATPGTPIADRLAAAAGVSVDGRVGRRADPTDSGTPACTGARRPVACGKPGAAAPRVSQATPARIAATARERRAWSGAANRVIRVARTARPRTGETRSG